MTETRTHLKLILREQRKNLAQFAELGKAAAWVQQQQAKGVIGATIQIRDGSDVRNLGAADLEGELARLEEVAANLEIRKLGCLFQLARESQEAQETRAGEAEEAEPAGTEDAE